MVSQLTFTAASATAAQPGGMSAFFVQMFPLLLIFVIFYFLLIRPQQKRAKDHQARLSEVKKGDDVITGGGLRGRVTKVSEDEVEVEIAQGVRVRAVKSTIAQVGLPAAKPAND